MLVRMRGSRECKLVQPLWKAVWSFLKKLKATTILSSDTTLRIYLKSGNNKRHLHTHVYCSIIHNSQATESPDVPQLMNELRKCDVCVCIHAVEYSAIKKNEIMSFSGKWMELDIIMLSEISQAQKDKRSCFL
jgi:hypothetical protein